MAHSNTRCRQLLPTAEIGSLAIQSAAACSGPIAGSSHLRTTLEMCFPANSFCEVVRYAYLSSGRNYLVSPLIEPIPTRRWILLPIYKAFLHADVVEILILRTYKLTLDPKLFSSNKMLAPPVPTSLQSSVDATKVEYVQLGSSGLRVSVPILGTMGIGSKEWQDWVMEEKEGLEVLKAAWDRGK